MGSCLSAAVNRNLHARQVKKSAEFRKIHQF